MKIGIEISQAPVQPNNDIQRNGFLLIDAFFRSESDDWAETGNLHHNSPSLAIYERLSMKISARPVSMSGV